MEENQEIENLEELFNNMCSDNHIESARWIESISDNFKIEQIEDGRIKDWYCNEKLINDEIMENEWYEKNKSYLD